MSENAILPEPPSSPRPGGRRTAVIAGITAGTLAIVGVGAFAAFSFLNGGAAAEQALPAESTLAVMSLDLDPSAGQKIEAFKTLQKFPALKKELKLGSADDLRKLFFDDVLADGDCRNLIYESDIKPWIGDNVAIAAASFEKGKVSPLVALAITDQDQAARGLDALLECSDAKDEAGYAFQDDFVLVSDSRAHAEKAVQQAATRSLSDDASYQSWTDKVGDRGILNFYVAKRAANLLADNLGDLGLLGVSGDEGELSGSLPSDFPSEAASAFPSDFPSELASSLPSDFPSELLTEVPGTMESSNSGSGASAPQVAFHEDHADDPSAAARKAIAGFRGAAGTLRFADGGAELHVVGGLTDNAVDDNSAVGDVVGGLPDDTAAVLGFTPPKDWADTMTSQLDDLGMFFGGEDGIRGLIEDELGLSLPGDLQTLLGDGMALSLRGTPPADLTAVDSPEDVPAGLTLAGDPDAISGVISKIEQKTGTTLEDEGVTVAKGSDRVALAFDADYAKDLLGDGDLGADATFQKVVPEADTASTVLYVDLNSTWRQAIADTLTDGTEELVTKQEFLTNTEALEAFGLSSWHDGADSHVLVKLTTD